MCALSSLQATADCDLLLAVGCVVAEGSGVLNGLDYFRAFRKWVWVMFWYTQTVCGGFSYVTSLRFYAVSASERRRFRVFLGENMFFYLLE